MFLELFIIIIAWFDVSNMHPLSSMVFKIVTPRQWYTDTSVVMHDSIFVWFCSVSVSSSTCINHMILPPQIAMLIRCHNICTNIMYLNTIHLKLAQVETQGQWTPWTVTGRLILTLSLFGRTNREWKFQLTDRCSVSLIPKYTFSVTWIVAIYITPVFLSAK